MDATLTATEPIRAFHFRYTAPRPPEYGMQFAVKLGILLRGRCRRFWRERQCDLVAGQTWLIGLCEPHGYAILEAPAELVLVVIRPQMLANLRFDEQPSFNALAPFTVPPAQRPQVAPENAAAMLRVGRRFATLVDHGHAHRGLWYRVLLDEALLLLYEHWSAPKSVPTLPADDYDRINRALQLVLANRRLVTAEEAAQVCGLRRRALNELFERQMGVSFSTFGLQYRLDGAAAQLRQSRLPVKAVATEWGFVDASHLNRCFLQHLGCTPVAYRQRLQ